MRLKRLLILSCLLIAITACGGSSGESDTPETGQIGTVNDDVNLSDDTQDSTQDNVQDSEVIEDNPENGNPINVPEQALPTEHFSLSGNIQGLTDRLILTNTYAENNTETLTRLSNGAFSFIEQLENGARYSVSVTQQPNSQSCQINNATGIINSKNIDNISVDCHNLYNIGGELIGLAGELRIQNNGSDTLTLASDGLFTFSQQLANGIQYNVDILSQPEHQHCEVQDASGTVTDADIQSIGIICTDNSYQVSGNLSGLASSEQEIETLRIRLSSENIQEDLILLEDGAFTFDNRLGVNAPYSVTVIQQPSPLSCTLENASGTIRSDVTNIELRCENQASSGVTISGSISLASNITVDRDTNDPNDSFQDNSSFETAQQINNLTTINGFLSFQATGNAGDRFELTSDQHDIYRVALQADQSIQLQVVDTDAGDLDLALFNENFELVAVSQLSGSVEQVFIEQTGIYYIDVYAFIGTSKYVLQLQSVNANTLGENMSLDFLANELIVKSNISTPKSMAASLSKSSAKLGHNDHRRATLARFSNKEPGRQTNKAQNKTHPVLDTLKQKHALSYDKWTTLKRLKMLRLDPEIEFAELNYKRYAQRIPDDQYYDFQWHYSTINLPQAWELTVGEGREQDVIVAVIDTGVYLDHIELDDKLVAGYDFISNLQNASDGDGIDPDPDDPGDSIRLGSSSWHGTHVAGTIGAESNNGVGIAGVSWETKIMPLRALGRFGGSSYDILQAVRFAAGLANDSGTLPAQTADIINLSLGGAGFSVAEENIYREVHDAGIIIVAAAGNENTSTLSYPASYEGVFSVSAIDASRDRAPYSNFGAAIDLAAPGGDLSADDNGDGQPDGILSALVNDANGQRQSSLSFYQGTSMAAPHVAGVFALMKAVNPELTAERLEQLLVSGELTIDEGDSGRDDVYGHGVIDAYKAVQAAVDTADSPPTAPETQAILALSPSALNFGDSSIANVTLLNQGTGSPRLTHISSEESWLAVGPTQVDDNGLGEYLIEIDRTGLVAGTYIGQIIFRFDNNDSLQLNISMTVGVISTAGKSAELYIVLYDPVEESVIEQTSADILEDGRLVYTFSNVPDGSYKIFAGSDVDNDQFICQFGEACGAYPSIESASEISVANQNITQLDFVTDILTSFGSIQSLMSDIYIHERKHTRIPENLERQALQ